MLDYKDLTFFGILDVFQAIAVHLLPQVVEDLDKTVISSAVVDDIVVVLICFCNGHGISGCDSFAECILSKLQILNITVAHTLAGKLDGQLLQGTANLQYVPQAFFRNFGNFGTFSGNH